MQPMGDCLSASAATRRLSPQHMDIGNQERHLTSRASDSNSANSIKSQTSNPFKNALQPAAMVYPPTITLRALLWQVFFAQENRCCTAAAIATSLFSQS